MMQTQRRCVDLVGSQHAITLEAFDATGNWHHVGSINANTRQACRRRSLTISYVGATSSAASPAQKARPSYKISSPKFYSYDSVRTGGYSIEGYESPRHRCKAFVIPNGVHDLPPVWRGSAATVQAVSLLPSPILTVTIVLSCG